MSFYVTMLLLTVAALVYLQSVDGSLSSIVPSKPLPPVLRGRGGDDKDKLPALDSEEGGASVHVHQAAPVPTVLVQTDVDKASTTMRPSSLTMLRHLRRRLLDRRGHNDLRYNSDDHPYWLFPGASNLMDPDDADSVVSAEDEWIASSSGTSTSTLEHGSVATKLGGNYLDGLQNAVDTFHSVTLDGRDGNYDADDEHDLLKDRDDNFVVGDDDMPEYSKVWMDRTTIENDNEEEDTSTGSDISDRDSNATAANNNKSLETLNGNITEIPGIGQGSWTVASSGGSCHGHYNRHGMALSLMGMTVLAWLLACPSHPGL